MRRPAREGTRKYLGRIPLPLLTPVKSIRYPPLLKQAPFAKIRLKGAYFIFGVSPEVEYILKKRDLKPGFLRIRDNWAIKDKIRPYIGLK